MMLFECTFVVIYCTCNMVVSWFTTGATSGTGTPYHSGGHEFNICFSVARIARSFSVCIMLCRSEFAICLSYIGHCFLPFVFLILVIVSCPLIYGF